MDTGRTTGSCFNNSSDLFLFFLLLNMGELQNKQMNTHIPIHTLTFTYLDTEYSFLDRSCLFWAAV